LLALIESPSFELAGDEHERDAVDVAGGTGLDK
jgi:hypothetical protein